MNNFFNIVKLKMNNSFNIIKTLKNISLETQFKHIMKYEYYSANTHTGVERQYLVVISCHFINEKCL